MFNIRIKTPLLEKAECTSLVLESDVKDDPFIRLHANFIVRENLDGYPDIDYAAISGGKILYSSILLNNKIIFHGHLHVNQCGMQNLSSNVVEIDIGGFFLQEKHKEYLREY